MRVHHAGVNPVDTLIRAGHFPYLPPTPYTPGGDLAGVVERVGAKVTSVKVEGIGLLKHNQIMNRSANVCSHRRRVARDSCDCALKYWNFTDISNLNIVLLLTPTPVP